MPEGDTLFRTARVLRRTLLGEEVVAARSRPGGARLELVVGSRVEDVRSQGKHLLIRFDGGLTLHTHLGMHGSWHRYRVSERWRRHPDAAVAVLETRGSVAVCFEAPVVELIDSRALAIHPSLSRLGPDLLAPEPDLASASARLRAPERAALTIAEALLDQGAVSGIGNVYRSEILWERSIRPFRPMRDLDEPEVRRILATAVAMLRAGSRTGTRIIRVYRRTGRPCPRCGTLIRSQAIGDPPRRLYWCPTCQAGEGGASTRRGTGA
jgi:endonuclease-8